MIEALWAIAAAVISGGFVILGVWLQGRKDSVRIKDVDDKTNKVEPTYNNTEKLLNKVDDNFKQANDNFKQVNENFKNADLKKVTEYVIKQDALQQAAKHTNFDLNLFVSQMQEQIKINAQLDQKVEELNRKIDEQEIELFNQEQTILELQENQRSRFSKGDEMEI